MPYKFPDPRPSYDTRGTPRLDPVPKRKRGAPIGNTNALKHGFYASALKAEKAAQLEEHNFTGLDEEREIIRYFIRRVIELGSETDNLEQAVSLLKVTAMAVTSLSRIYRTEMFLGVTELPPMHKWTYEEFHGSTEPEPDNPTFIDDTLEWGRKHGMA